MGVRCIDRDKLKKADSWSLALAMWDFSGEKA